ncbi:DUF5838 family protein [Thermoproteota archaeon]
MDNIESYKKFLAVNQPSFPEPKIIDSFEHLLRDWKKATLEYSVKIKDGKAYPFRINVWHKTPRFAEYKRAMSFLNEIGKIEPKIDYSKVIELIKVIDLNKLDFLIVGIDLRERIQDSRFKIWFIANNYPEKIAECLEMHGKPPEVDECLHDDNLLFGLDFFPGGKSRIKIYPEYLLDGEGAEQNLDKLKKLLKPRTSELAEKCSRIHISFSEDHFKRVIHFKPKNPDEFLNKISDADITDINDQYKQKGFSLDIVSALEDDIEQKAVKEINLYYVLPFVQELE